MPWHRFGVTVQKIKRAAITPYKNKVAELYQSYKNILIKVAEHKEKDRKAHV